VWGKEASFERNRTTILVFREKESPTNRTLTTRETEKWSAEEKSEWYAVGQMEGRSPSIFSRLDVG
jgi:hypothetical protein